MGSYWNIHQNRIIQICNSIKDEVPGHNDSEYCEGEPKRYKDPKYKKYTLCGLITSCLNENYESYPNQMIYSDDNRNTIGTIISTFKEKLLHYGILIISIETFCDDCRVLDHIFTLYQDYNSVKIVDSYVQFWLPRIRDMNWIDFENKLGQLINIIQNEPNGYGINRCNMDHKKYVMIDNIWCKLWGLPVSKDIQGWLPTKDLRIKYWYPNNYQEF